MSKKFEICELIPFYCHFVKIAKDIRGCTKCRRIQGYSQEKKRWLNLDYLETTSFDNLKWVKMTLSGFRLDVLKATLKEK